MTYRHRKKRLPFCAVQQMVYPEEQNLYAKGNRLYLVVGHKKCPIEIEQLDRLPCEVDYYHLLNAAKIGTIFETTKFFCDFF